MQAATYEKGNIAFRHMQEGWPSTACLLHEHESSLLFSLLSF